MSINTNTWKSSLGSFFSGLVVQIEEVSIALNFILAGLIFFLAGYEIIRMAAVIMLVIDILLESVILMEKREDESRFSTFLRIVSLIVGVLVLMLIYQRSEFTWTWIPAILFADGLLEHYIRGITSQSRRKATVVIASLATALSLVGFNIAIFLGLIDQGKFFSLAMVLNIVLSILVAFAVGYLFLKRTKEEQSTTTQIPIETEENNDD